MVNLTSNSMVGGVNKLIQLCSKSNQSKTIRSIFNKIKFWLAYLITSKRSKELKVTSLVLHAMDFYVIFLILEFHYSATLYFNTCILRFNEIVGRFIMPVMLTLHNNNVQQKYLVCEGTTTKQCTTWICA